MEYAYLGQTGVRVSRLCLGTATFGIAPLAADAPGLISRALDLGINFFDTANSYGNQARFDRPTAPPADQRPAAEELLGQALKGRRDEVIIASKVMEPVGTGPNDRGLSRVHIMQQIERTLRRLQTDHIDLYYAHHPDPTTPIEQTIQAFDDLVRQGKIRYWALSTYPAWMIMDMCWTAKLMGCALPVALQTGYNLVWRMVERDVIPACLRTGLTMNLFSPLAGGLLSGLDVLERAYTGSQRWGFPGYSDDEIAVGRQVSALAKEWGVPPAQVALNWLWSRPAVTSAIIGPEAVTELEASAAALDLKLDAEQLAAVDAINRPAPAGFFA